MEDPQQGDAAAADGLGDWEVVAKRDSYLLQKPEDSDDDDETD